MSHAGTQRMAWQKDEIAAQEHPAEIAAYVAKGHLQGSNRIVTIVFIVVFLCLFSLPAIWQVYLEYKQKSDILILLPFKDIFIQPEQKANELRTQLQSVDARLSIGNWSDSGSVEWEDLSQQVVQAWQMKLIENRYLQGDSNLANLSTWKELKKASLQLQDQAYNGVPISKDQIQTFRTQLFQIQQGYDVATGILPWLNRFVVSIKNQTLFSRKYLRAWETNLEDNSLLALTTRPWMQLAMFNAFQDWGEKGLAGLHGYLFYRPGIEYAVRPWVTDSRSRIVDPNDKQLTDDPIATIVAFKNQLQALGIQLLVVPIPNKETIYPDYLSHSVPASQSGRIGHGEGILDSLKSKGVSVVNLYQKFAEARSQDSSPQDALYLRDDTHWTLRGLQVAAKEVATALKKSGWLDLTQATLSYNVQTCQVPRKGDIVVMSKLPEAQFGSYKLSFPEEATACQRIFLDSIPYKDDFRNSQILILGDSFSRIYQTDAPLNAGWIAHLAKELQMPLASLVSDGGASTLVREKLARKPGVLRGKKVVVWEFVERDYRFGDNGWKQVSWESK